MRLNRFLNVRKAFSSRGIHQSGRYLSNNFDPIIALRPIVIPSSLQHRAYNNDYTYSKFEGNEEHHPKRIRFNLSVLLAFLVFCDSTMCSNESHNQAESDEIEKLAGINYDTKPVITNWSSTHTCSPNTLFEPKSGQEICRILKYHSDKKQKIRPIGTALSPNGIGMSSINLLSVHELDYIEVDPVRSLVTVGAGARVSDVLSKLNNYGLTLENFSSIQEQQIAGWTQVSAHGTGCTLPPVDMMISRMKIATPENGILTLSSNLLPDLFSYARVGLGSLGVVTELTLKCVPKFKLKENTVTTSTKLIENDHVKRLLSFRHVRYMWLPHTDCVVVITSDAYDEHKEAIVKEPELKSSHSKLNTQSLVNLLLEINPTFGEKEAEKLSFSQLRDLLLDYAPLDLSHIRKVNLAEAEFWKASTGLRVDDSTNILGFDCGGEQHVYEVCFPIGSNENELSQNKDIKFVQKLMKLIEVNQLPAPSPIEQRWSLSSSSPMSPAYSNDPQEIFSWVGVIMYLPPGQTEEGRRKISEYFEKYKEVMQPLLEEYNAHCHWAKIELPKKDEQNSENYEKKLQEMQKRLRSRYNADNFNDYRRVLDKNNILSNDLIEELFKD